MDEKNPHSAYLRLDVCIVEPHNNHAPRIGQGLFFPVSAEQAKSVEYLTLRELEFECLENPDTPRSNAKDTASEQETETAKHPLSISSIISRLRPPSPPQANQTEVMLSGPAETHRSDGESSPVPSTSERVIKSLCSTIQNIPEMFTNVGVLVSNNSKYQVLIPRAPLTSARVLSLAELLSLPKPQMSERLKLCVVLASSVLQLHGTEWLPKRWGKQDIYLIQGDSSRSSRPSLDTPVVRHAFTPDSVPEASIESHTIDCNLSLFSLGIVLIELFFWRSLESFQASEPQDCHGTSDRARYTAAKRLINAVYEGAGDNYGIITQRCIECLDHRDTRMENNEFKNKVYHKVLQPLEKNLESYCNKPLEEIFQKRVS